MTIKILAAALLLLTGFIWLYCSFPKRDDETSEKPIDKAWWDGLSEEWREILRINQYFQKHQIDFYKVQQEYLNRLKDSGDASHTALNTPLRALHEKKLFLLSYNDMYARVLKAYPDSAGNSIDLVNLHTLDRIYMVSGPGDLTPLKKLPKLRVLIANYCGLDRSIPFDKQTLDLEPLRKLTNLEHLHCVSPVLKSLEPLKDITSLTHLNCENSDVTSLEPLKKLHKLETLSFGSKVKNASVIAHLSNLQDLHISGCKEIPNFSGLNKLKSLCIIENEMAIVDGAYRIKDLGFLKNLSSLEFLDFELTSYKGSLDKLKNLKKLKAVTLPRVPTSDMQAFKVEHKDCIVLNEYEW